MIDRPENVQSLQFLSHSKELSPLPFWRGNLYQDFFKRGIDLFLFFISALIIAPILLLLMTLVKLDSRGPAIYRSSRIGKDGKKFFCLKLRTMCLNAEEKLEELLCENNHLQEEWKKDHKLRKDPRVTRVGHVIRALSLDELPQIINVFRGEMSFVGPRPIVEAEIEKYEGDFHYYLRVRPGITGLWQINGRNDLAYDRRVQLDKKYSINHNLKLDLNILFKTLPVILSKKGAY